MNYYEEIKKKIINNEIYGMVKDYSKEISEVQSKINNLIEEKKKLK